VEASIGNQKRSAACPKCGGPNELDARSLIGEFFDCPGCGRTLEVASPEPLVLEVFHNVEEDEEDLQGFEARR
jgi:lysine biosynthesis protein LysW